MSGNIMNKLNSVIAFVGTLLIIGLLIAGYFAWKSLREENLYLRNEVTQFRKLTDTLVRSSNKWATKEDLEVVLKEFLTKKDLNKLRDDMNRIDSRLTAVGRTMGSIKAKVTMLEASDREGPENKDLERCDDGRLVDVYGYTKKPQIKEIDDSNKAPIAEVYFDASKRKPWSYNVFQKDYRIITVVGKKDSGQLTFHHKLEYSVPEKDEEKYYKINLLSSDYLQVPLKNKMFWFNPVLDVNFFAGANVYEFANGFGRANNLLSIGGDLGLSFSSYGETKADSWFRLFRIGLGYDAERRAAHLSLAPITFNLGKPLPLLTNLYLAPQIGVDSAGGMTINVGIGPQF